MAELFILLDPNSEGNLIYFPGNVLKGIVELHLTSERKIRGLNLMVYGRCKTYRSDDESKRIQLQDGTYKDQYSGKEIYVGALKYLLGQQHGPFFKMTPGIYKYNFAFELPKHLPYSLKVLHGDISYHVGAALEVSDHQDIEHLVPITIVRNDDLRLIPKLQAPHEAEYVYTFCCCFCKSLPISLTVILPRTGFVSGEQIPITINYVNKSYRDISNTVIKLKRRIVYYFDTPKLKQKEFTETLIEFNLAGVKRFSSKKIEEDFCIPLNLMNSNEEFCRLIRISYYLSVDMDVDALSIQSELYVPITIGSTLLITDEMTNHILQPSAPEGQSNNDDLPPSFAEAMKIGKSENLRLLQQPRSSKNIGWIFKK